MSVEVARFEKAKTLSQSLEPGRMEKLKGSSSFYLRPLDAGFATVLKGMYVGYGTLEGYVLQPTEPPDVRR
jgi:hypothetical protein